MFLSRIERLYEQKKITFLDVGGLIVIRFKQGLVIPLKDPEVNLRYIENNTLTTIAKKIDKSLQMLSFTNRAKYEECCDYIDSFFTFNPEDDDDEDI